jgi:hypothetical protein
MDHEGFKPLLERTEKQFGRLKPLWVDSAYRGEDKGKDWVKKTLGRTVGLVERPRKPAPEEVPMGGLPSGKRRARRPIDRSFCRREGSTALCRSTELVLYEVGQLVESGEAVHTLLFSNRAGMGC